MHQLRFMSFHRLFGDSERGDKMVIDGSLCAGDNCRLCERICPVKAIYPDKQG